MSDARNSAADLLLAFDRRPTFVQGDLEARRESLEDTRDRGLLTELVYGTIRRRGTLDAVLSRFSKRPVPGLNAAVRTALRIGLHQILFLDRVPSHAAVDHAVSWARGRAGPKRAGYVNGVLRSVLRGIEGRADGPDRPRTDVPREDGSALRFGRPVFADPEKHLARHLAERWSAPTWLVSRWLEAFGPDRTRQILRASLTRPGLGVRARVDVDDLAGALAEQGLDVEHADVEGALLLGGGDAQVLDAVRAGRAAIQDPSSQRIAPLAEPRPGMRVLDLCAAPGGKTLHLADLMQSGTVVAADVDAAKLDALRLLEETIGSDVRLEVVQVEPTGPLPFEPQSFDAVLVDAPCTNTGVLRRRVEARWRLSEADVGTLAEIQLGLLERALPLVKPGGLLVYSTCSLEPEEDEGVYQTFTSAHPEVEGRIAFRVFPAKDRDGGFAATFRVPPEEPTGDP